MYVMLGFYNVKVTNVTYLHTCIKMCMVGTLEESTLRLWKLK